MSTGESKELMREETQATREKLNMVHEQNQPMPTSLAGESSGTCGDEGKQAYGRGGGGDNPREGKSGDETATTTSVSKSWRDIKQVQIVCDGDDGVDHDENDFYMFISGARLSLLLEMDYVATLLSGRWSTDDGGSRDWECLSCGSECGQDLDECDLCGLSRGWVSDDCAPPPTTDHPVLHLPCQRGVLEEIFSLHECGTLTEGREPTCEVLAAGKVQIVCMICCWRHTRTCLAWEVCFLTRKVYVCEYVVWYCKHPVQWRQHMTCSESLRAPRTCY
jgi:hypothetical protein